MQIKIANRENSVYKVSGRMSLLQELREQGVDLPYGCQYGGCTVSYTHLTLPTNREV